MNSFSQARDLSSTPSSHACESYSEIFDLGERGFTGNLCCHNIHNLQLTLNLGTPQSQILVLTLVG